MTRRVGLQKPHPGHLQWSRLIIFEVHHGQHLTHGQRARRPARRLPVGAVEPTERMEVTLLVRRRAQQELTAHVAAIESARAPGSYLSREEFAKRHGADASDLAKVRAFAAAHGLAVSRSMRLDAPWCCRERRRSSALPSRFNCGKCILPEAVTAAVPVPLKCPRS